MRIPSKTTDIVVHLMGGLANQMFQYAAALALAERLGGRVHLDRTAYERGENWPYQLDVWQIPQDFRSIPPRPRGVGKLLKSSPVMYFRESHFHVDERFFSLTGNPIYLHGYFQSARYFENAESALRKRFRPVQALGAKALEWQGRIDGLECPVSLHVRRGDYLKHADTHTNTGMDYYRRATEVMQGMSGGRAHFVIFSDDPAWCRENFRWLAQSTVVESDGPAVEEMLLMARCHHHIVANSSFSWWGAWLNARPEKRVVAPYLWFTREVQFSKSPVDLHMPGWIVLR